MQKTAIGFSIAGAVIFGLGFWFPRPSNNGTNIGWRTWRGSWDIQFCGENAPEGLFIAKFDQIQAEGGVFQAKIYNENDSNTGSFQRLEPSANTDDYRLIKGQFKTTGGKVILVELALHANKELFTGLVYESKSTKRFTCWGKKR